mmetsp:Transcript_58947/g.137277  ORF Transcript_58947/g.137277 Transcript_58947/m.137277 type:complete len:219 (-) Transcript_58947:134-790(-)
MRTAPGLVPRSAGSWSGPMETMRVRRSKSSMSLKRLRLQQPPMLGRMTRRLSKRKRGRRKRRQSHLTTSPRPKRPRRIPPGAKLKARARPTPMGRLQARARPRAAWACRGPSTRGSPAHPSAAAAVRRLARRAHRPGKAARALHLSWRASPRPAASPGSMARLGRLGRAQRAVARWPRLRALHQLGKSQACHRTGRSIGPRSTGCPTFGTGPPRSPGG